MFNFSILNVIGLFNQNNQRPLIELNAKRPCCITLRTACVKITMRVIIKYYSVILKSLSPCRGFIRERDILSRILSEE